MTNKLAARVPTCNGACIALIFAQCAAKLPQDTWLLHLLAVVNVALDPLPGEAWGEGLPIERPAVIQPGQRGPPST
jgi:hypothetical protein